MAAKFEGIIWISSLIFRLLWALIPQTGYIHPDEFFQSPEVVAGDVFGFQTLRTWEFNSTFPIRSILFPHVVSGLPFTILHQLQSLTIISVNTWILLVAPRLVVCCISTIIDLSAYKISNHLQVDPAPVLAVIGSSYITLVFHTRPFSNTLESVLFALLLWLLANHLIPTERHRVGLNNISIGIVIVAGIWNRPTFLTYALIPILAWCYRFCKDISLLSTIAMIKEGCVVARGAVVAIVLFVAVDSTYYNNFTITPWNFIKYNLDTSQLKEHGIHPRFTHLIVNMPLLFGLLAIVYYYHAVVMAFANDFTVTKLVNCQIIRSTNTKEKTKQNALTNSKIVFYKVLTLSIITPIGLLSIIPHQEARFLTPILLPLALLFAHIVIGPKQLSLVTVSWLLWNVIGCVLFGVLHQGGMYSCLQYLQGHMSSVSLHASPTTHHVVFSNTYMPPRHLLAWSNCSKKDCAVRDQLVVHDLSGMYRDELSYWLDHFLENGMDKNKENQVMKCFCLMLVSFDHITFTSIDCTTT